MRRPRALFGVVAVLLIVAAFGWAVWYQQSLSRPAGDNVALPSLAEKDPVVDGPHIDLPTSGSMLVIGDSWTAGVAADKPTDGFAYRAAESLGLEPEVFGFGSVGYVNEGPLKAGGFLGRFKLYGPPEEADLVVLQGSQNDIGIPKDEVGAAVQALIRDVEDRYPHATVVVMGPAPATSGLAGLLVPVDREVRAAADTEGVPYISPLDERWFTASDWGGPRFSASSPHPTTEGHAYVARRLVADLREMNN